MRISWPRTHIPSRVSAAFQTSRARLRRSRRDERQDVALETGVLGQPEVDDRQERQDRGDRLGDGQPDLDDLARRRRGAAGGWSVRAAASISAVRLRDRPAGRIVAAHSRGPLEERRQRGERPLELGRSPPARSTRAIPTTTRGRAP